MTQRAMRADVALRAATSADAAALQKLVSDTSAGTPYEELPAYFLRLALAAPSEESRAIVAVQDGAVVGCALYGVVAGAIGTGRIHFVAVAAGSRRLGIASRLCGAAVDELSARAARNVIVELPDDRVVDSGRALLERCAFTEVARVPDYHRDGVALVVLQRAVSPVE